jgi:hypothetical protein
MHIGQITCNSIHFHEPGWRFHAHRSDSHSIQAQGETGSRRFAISAIPSASKRMANDLPFS